MAEPTRLALAEKLAKRGHASENCGCDGCATWRALRSADEEIARLKEEVAGWQRDANLNAQATAREHQRAEEIEQHLADVDWVEAVLGDANVLLTEEEKRRFIKIQANARIRHTARLAGFAR